MQLALLAIVLAADGRDNAMFEAIEHGDVQWIKMRISQGDALIQSEATGETALHAVAEHDQPRIASLLLAAGVPADSRTRDGYTPLHYAAHFGHVAVASLLLQHDASLLEARVKALEHTALLLAAEEGHTDMVRLLLAHNASCAARTSTGHTALHAASQFGWLHVARMLLDAGAEVDVSTSLKEERPLHIASQFGHAHIAQLLIAAGATIGARRSDGQEASHVAAEYGQSLVLQVLLEAGASVDSRSAMGDTPLTAAVAAQQETMIDGVALLLAHNASVHVRDTVGNTPLHKTCFHGCTVSSNDCTARLIAHGAHVDATTPEGISPLFATVYFCAEERRQHLERRVRPMPLPKSTTVAGGSSSERRTGSVECTDSERRTGSEECTDSERRTGSEECTDSEEAPLSCLPVVRTLLAAGASPTAMTRTGDTPLSVAFLYGLKDVLLLLRDGFPRCHRGREISDSSDSTNSSHRSDSDSTNSSSSDCDAALDTAALAQTDTAHRLAMMVARAKTDVLTPKRLPMTVGELSFTAEEASQRDAVASWLSHGVVVFPGLIPDATIRALKAQVDADRLTAAHVDRAPNIRGGDLARKERIFTGMRIQSCAAALSAMASRLAPFLRGAFGSAEQLLFESAYMVTLPGALEQDWHSDAGPLDPRVAAVQIALVDTPAGQGELQVIPDSHVIERAEPKVQIASIPAGTVTFYALSTVHRGGANTRQHERVSFTFGLLGKGGLLPPLFPFAYLPADAWRWWLADGELVEQPLVWPFHTWFSRTAGDGAATTTAATST